MKRLVCPEALRINKLAPGRKYCGLVGCARKLDGTTALSLKGSKTLERPHPKNSIKPRRLLPPPRARLQLKPTLVPSTRFWQDTAIRHSHPPQEAPHTSLLFFYHDD